VICALPRARSRPGQFEVAADLFRGVASGQVVQAGGSLKILLVADDFEGPRAEQYGYVNRAIADDELDCEIDAMARDWPRSIVRRSSGRTNASHR
jgi:enoyl-CoA hydratase/carnithine racemase